MLAKMLEPLTAIGCAVAAVSVGALDPGLAAGAAIGGAGLLARFREGCAKHGLESAHLIEKMRVAVMSDWDRADQSQAERDAIALASNAIGEHIAACLPTREALAAVASDGSRDFPGATAALVVDRLAACNAECMALFAAAVPPAPEATARRFALDVVQRAVRLAKDDPDYAPLLTLDIVIGMAGGVGRIEDKVEVLLARVGAIEQARNITDEALIALARRIAAQVDDPAQALAALSTAIDEFLRVREAAARGTNLGELVDQTLRNIAAANERGAFDEGARLGAQAFAEWEERQEAQRQAGLRLIEANIEQEGLRFNAAGIAYWIGERLKLIGSGTIDFYALRAERREWYERGLIRGLRLDTDVSIGLARLLIEHAGSKQAWAAGQIDLGDSLQTQGERTGGAAGQALLVESGVAYGTALTVYTESAMPVDWAGTQNNLGNVRQTLGARIGGGVGLALLDEAVAAYRAALTVYTQSAMPVDWAMTQNNLGNALNLQAELIGGAAGLELSARAVAAFSAALTVHTQSAMPSDWAGTQNNLGNALSTQGVFTGGATGLALLADAVVAYRAALTVCSKNAMPARWAMTQNNIGNALSRQGERTEGAPGLALLNEAVTAYRAALTIWTAEHFGPSHERANRNLNRALALIAERSA